MGTFPKVQPTLWEGEGWALDFSESPTDPLWEPVEGVGPWTFKKIESIYKGGGWYKVTFVLVRVCTPLLGRSSLCAMSKAVRLNITNVKSHRARRGRDKVHPSRSTPATVQMSARRSVGARPPRAGRRPKQMARLALRLAASVAQEATVAPLRREQRRRRAQSTRAARLAVGPCSPAVAALRRTRLSTAAARAALRRRRQVVVFHAPPPRSSRHLRPPPRPPPRPPLPR